MEGGSTPSSSSSHLPLKNFIIPRKQRGQEVSVEPCLERSREFTLIQTILSNSRLVTGPAEEQWKTVHLVHNSHLLREFIEKRAEMRAGGRSGREMEERWCFLVVSEEMTSQVYTRGLRVGGVACYALGKPAYGVHLFKNVDMALRSASGTDQRNLLIFKVLLGKVKKVGVSVVLSKTQDPTVNFDCHMFKKLVSCRDPPQLQLLGSTVFFFDFNENQELNERPRQCLPYAIVSYVPTQTTSLTSRIISSGVPAKTSVHGLSSQFKSCTVAVRSRKEKTTQVTFKYYDHPYSVFPNHGQQTHNSESTSSSSSLIHQSDLEQNRTIIEPTNFNSSKCEKNDIKQPKSKNLLDKVPNPVSTHKSKDMHQQETNQREKSPCVVSEHHKQTHREICPTRAHNSGSLQLVKNDSSSSMKSSMETGFVKNLMVKTGQSRTVNMLKLKLRKYGEYLRMNEEERHRFIQSKENMSPEQKQALAERIKYYDFYCTKYKIGLLSQKRNQKPPGHSEKFASLYCPTDLARVDVSAETDGIQKGSVETDLPGCLAKTSDSNCGDIPEPNIREGLQPMSELDSTNQSLTTQNVSFDRIQALLYSASENTYRAEHQNVHMQNITCSEEQNITCSGEHVRSAPSENCMDIASFVEVSNCTEICWSSSDVQMSQELQGQWSFRKSMSLVDSEVYSEQVDKTVEDNNNIYGDLYQRLQKKELFPNEIPVLSSKSYLRNKSDIHNSEFDVEQHNTLETLNLCRTDFYLSIDKKPNKISSPASVMPLLSERFAKIKCLKTSDNTVIDNRRLVQLLSQKFNRSEHLLKHRRAIKRYCKQKQQLFKKRFTNSKKKGFWIKRSLGRTQETSSDLFHVSETISAVEEHGLALQRMFHKSDVDIAGHDVQILASQEADTCNSPHQHYCSSPVLEAKTLAEVKVKPNDPGIRLQDPSTIDLKKFNWSNESVTELGENTSAKEESAFLSPAKTNHSSEPSGVQDPKATIHINCNITMNSPKLKLNPCCTVKPKCCLKENESTLASTMEVQANDPDQNSDAKLSEAIFTQREELTNDDSTVKSQDSVHEDLRGTPVVRKALDEQYLADCSLQLPHGSDIDTLTNISPPNTTKIIGDANEKGTILENHYSPADISGTLKIADQTRSLAELDSIHSKCMTMLQEFILNFERDQGVPFNQSFISRDLILNQYLEQLPPEVDLKYEAVNSFLELQMMLEAVEFVENKRNFLRGKSTVRSLLWFDHSLCADLFKGEIGFQQQSSLYSSFQKSLVQQRCSNLHQYYRSVQSVHQRIFAHQDVSYYLYLKSKREFLEIQTALQISKCTRNFFLSVPLASMINFGNSLEKLGKVQRVMMAFLSAPLDQLLGTFDVAKAEHLVIACRFLYEKAHFIRSHQTDITSIPWFGVEHLIYDASRVLVSHRPRWTLNQLKRHGTSIATISLQSQTPLYTEEATEE